MDVSQPYKRSFVRNALVLLDLVLATACAHRPPAAEPPPRDAVDVTYPQRLEGFRFVNKKASENREWGTQLRYLSEKWPDLILDTFVYIVGFTPDDELVIGSFEAEFADYMAAAVEQGSYLAYLPKEAGRHRVKLKWAEKEGFRAYFELNTSSGPLTSFTYLFYRAPFAVKFRASHPAAAPAEQVAEEVDRFVSLLLPELSMIDTANCPDGLSIELHLEPDRAEDDTTTAIADALVEQAKRGCADYDLLVGLKAELLSPERSKSRD